MRPVGGAVEAFFGLRERGVKVALTTGFDRDTTTLLLSALGWLKNTVDAIVCGDDVVHGRPEPDLILRAMAHVGVSDARFGGESARRLELKKGGTESAALLGFAAEG